MKSKMLICLFFVLIAGCGDSGSSSETRIFTEQEQALNKAKEVEAKVLEAAEAQRQTINEETDNQ